MKKLIIFICAMMLLTSCLMTHVEQIEEIKKEKAICNALGMEVYQQSNGYTYCKEKGDKIMKCIREYTNGLDEKYNNPDHVTNLREDNYSDVVKTCNEIFGEKEILKTNDKNNEK